MIWKRLSRDYLQKAIGENILQSLEIIIPSLQSENIQPQEIYRKKNLTKIFEAFTNAQVFKEKQFKRLFLNALLPEELNKICLETGVASVSNSFAQKVEEHVKAGWRDENYCKGFLRALDLPDVYLPVKKQDIINEEEAVASLSPYKILKDYQFQIYIDCMKKLAIPRSRFIVQMPTGSGKTRTSMEFITEYLNRSQPGTVVLWLAHSEELCEQAVQCFKEVWSHVGTKNLKIFRCWGTGAKLPYLFADSAFIVGGFQKLHSLLKKNEVPFTELGKRIYLLIVDEAHRVLAPTYKAVTKALTGNQTRLVGLTATPGRNADDISSNQQLAKFFFNQIFSIRTPSSKTVIQYLREKGVLSHTNFEPLVTNLGYELSEKQRAYLEKKFDFPPGFLSKLANDDLRNLEIIKRLDTECKQQKQILFFACSIDHSKFICSLLIYLGYEAVHIDGSTDKTLRQKYLDAFVQGKIQVVCNYGVLSTGFDAPKTDTVFISRPTNSLVLYSQMIGRGMRGPAIGGTAECKIIDVKDNIYGLPDEENIYDYFKGYYEEV